MAKLLLVSSRETFDALYFCKSLNSKSSKSSISVYIENYEVVSAIFVSNFKNVPNSIKRISNTIGEIIKSRR